MFETALRVDNVEPCIEQVRGHRMFELVFNYNFGHGNSIIYRGRIQDGVRKSNMRRTEMNIKPLTPHHSPLTPYIGLVMKCTCTVVTTGGNKSLTAQQIAALHTPVHMCVVCCVLGGKRSVCGRPFDQVTAAKTRELMVAVRHFLDRLSETKKET